MSLWIQLYNAVSTRNIEDTQKHVFFCCIERERERVSVYIVHVKHFFHLDCRQMLEFVHLCTHFADKTDQYIAAKVFLSLCVSLLANVCIFLVVIIIIVKWNTHSKTVCPTACLWQNYCVLLGSQTKCGVLLVGCHIRYK